MKKIIYVTLLITGVLACSSPKYTASFNSYDSKTNNYITNQVQPVEEHAATVEPEQLLASTSNTPVEFKTETMREEVRKTYLQMSKSERKQLRSDIKSYVKAAKKNVSVESVQATKAMDNDLKLAAIFGAVGLVAMFIGTELFWVLGGIALIIGTVFFVKWLVRQ